MQQPIMNDLSQEARKYLNSPEHLRTIQYEAISQIGPDDENLLARTQISQILLRISPGSAGPHRVLTIAKYCKVY